MKRSRGCRRQENFETPDAAIDGRDIAVKDVELLEMRRRGPRRLARL